MDTFFYENKLFSRPKCVSNHWIYLHDWKMWIILESWLQFQIVLSIHETWKYWWDVQLDQFIILFQLSVVGSISSSIFCTWVSWLGIGKKKSERVKLLFCQSLHLCWWWSRWSRWWRWLIIVTHHLVPLLLALRGQDRGADCAWALALHICSYFDFSSLLSLNRLDAIIF